MYQKILKIVALTMVGIFAFIGFSFTAIFFAMQFGLLNVRGSIAERNNFFGAVIRNEQPCDDTALTCPWNRTPEWATIRSGLQKDAEIIERVSKETGVSERMIVAVVIPEQIRFFTAEREVFKRYFEPLKILGSLSQFSLGVSGIKQETAVLIERYANDPFSPFYPGAGMDRLITYPAGTEHNTELYNRLTDPKNHYYSYLYTALFIKEIQSHWKREGFDIQGTPGVVVTLFNIGFQASNPNGAPVTGGAPVTIGGNVYTFGEVGELFFNSDELTDVFPK